MVFDIAACAKKIDEDEFNDSVLDLTEEICEAVLRLDYESIDEVSDKVNKDLPTVMPIDKDVDMDYEEFFAYGAFQAVASTLDYEIDDDIDSDPEKGTASVDVTFTYKDYTKIQGEIDYVDALEFGNALEDLDDEDEIKITLEFERNEDDEILLTNAKELNKVFEYDGLEVSFLEDLFDLIDDSEYLGTYDEARDCFIAPSSLGVRMYIGERGQRLTWTYKYKICKDWEQLYLSDWISVDYPDEIVINYDSPDGSVLEPGYYQIIIYQTHDDYISMYEVEVVDN